MQLKKSMRFVFRFLFWVIIAHQNIQAQNEPSIKIVIGALVASVPDSTYHGTVDVFVGDSLTIGAIHLMVVDTAAPTFNTQVNLSALPISMSLPAWKEGNTIHIDVPIINPFYKKKYTVELLTGSGQLILLLETDY
jgi:hypothetical protein